MSDAHNPQSVVLEKTVADARRLLDYAVSRGIIKDTSVITAIINVEAKLASGVMPEHSDIEAFLKAYNTLSEVTGGVSGESLSPESAKDARRTKNIYTTTLTCLLIFLIPISTVTLTGKRLIEETLADIDYVCKNETMGCWGQPYKTPSPPKVHAENTDPSEPSPKMQVAISSPSEPSQKMQVAISSPSEPSPKMQVAVGAHSNLSSDGGSPSAIQLPYDADVRTFQIQDRMKKVAWTVISFNSALRKLNDQSELEKQNDLIMTFHKTRVYADRVKVEFDFWYDTLAGCLLPIAFAALGAVTFGLRDLRQRLEEKTWTPQGQALPSLRIVIALLVGFLISLFTDFSTKTGLTPIALAFVMGYSVDVFFTFIDSVVTRLKTPVATPAKPAAV